MNSIDFSLFSKTLSGLKSLPPVLFLVGEEEALLSDGLKAFLKVFHALHGEAMMEFNQDILYGDKDNFGRVLDACQTFPVGMERRIVILHEAQEISPTAEKDLENYLKSPNPTTSLVILWKDSPTTVLKKGVALAAAQAGLLVKCWRLSDETKRAEWVRLMFAERGRPIEPDACRLLAQEGGESLLELKGEIEKLLLFTSSGGTIHREDVRQTLSFRPDQIVWNFVNHLEASQVPQAGRAMERCLDQGEEPFLILNLMARSARKIAQAGAGVGARGKPVWPDIFARIRESDLALKSGHGVESGILERLLTFMRF